MGIKHFRKIWIVAFIFLFLWMNISCFDNGTISAGSSNLYVAIDGGASFTRIQDAIDAADPDDIIYVSNGMYYENLNINKSISLIGASESNTTIHGNNDIVISIQTENATIQGFTLKHGSIGINLTDSSYIIIKENTIINSNYGVFLNNDCNNNMIFSNNFINNSFHAYDESSTSQYHTSSTGNYWDDYTGSDSNDDGFGETPYDISGGSNQDLYPLIEPITKKPLVHFIYSPSDPTTQDTIQFTDDSEDADGYITTWLWNFGDGSSSTEKNPIHSYKDDGVYEVVLEVTDNYGSVNQMTQILIILNVAPTADFTVNPKVPLDIQNVDFKDISMDLDGTIVNRIWMINETLFFYGTTFQYKFPDDGTYTITLQVTDDDNATSSLTKNINVLNVGPIASFSYYYDNGSIMKNMPIHFHDNSHDSDGAISSYQWDFDDGTGSNEENPTHSFSEDGVYKISLTISDDDGVYDSFSKSIRIGEQSEPIDIISGLSVFDIFMVIFILIMVIFVIIVSKKYS